MLRYAIMGAVMILAGFITAASAKSDKTFLAEAVQINLAEISVGQLAQKNGGSDKVKSFGKMLVDDHTASNTKATSIAQANGVTPPTEPKAADKKKYDELKKLSGAEFIALSTSNGGGSQASHRQIRDSVKGKRRYSQVCSRHASALEKTSQTAQSLG